MSEIEIVIKLLVALILGGLLGVERTRAGKSAGLRTLGLVALGAALFVIISQHLFFLYHDAVDPSRIASNIVTGIGFLGAGMIIFHRKSVTNLTTAAGVWLSAAIGAAVGYGMFIAAIATTVLVIITFTIMWDLEAYLKRKLSLRSDVDDENDA